MGFSDDWTSCMHRMQLPTPSEAWHSAAEALEKLHEIDMAMGGIGLAEAAESFEAVGVAIEVGAEAAPILVSWWAGNAVGCIVKRHREVIAGREVLAHQHHIAERARVGDHAASAVIGPDDLPDFGKRAVKVQPQRRASARHALAPRTA